MKRSSFIVWVPAIVAAGCARADGAATLERNKQLVRRAHVEVRSRGNLNIAEGDLVVTRFTTRGTFASQPGEPSKQWTVEGLMDVRHLDAGTER